MSISMVELSPSLQGLIDERLDAIERISLMAGVSRGERRGILGEVEAHVFELLGRRTSGEPTREDVLAVLAQLDPPESYAPEGFDRRLLKEGWPTPRRREPELSLLALGSAVVGAFLAPMLVLSIILDNPEALIVVPIAILGVSITGACSMAKIQRSHGWLYGLRPALFATLLFPLLAANACAALCLAEMSELVVFIGIGIAFLTLNGAIVYVAWRLCSVWQPRPRQS